MNANGQLPRAEPPEERELRLGQRIWVALKEYLLKVGIFGVSIEAVYVRLETLSAFVRGGPVSWLGLGALLATIGATVFLTWQRGALPLLSVELWDGTQVAAPVLAAPLAILVITLGWAYLLVGAAGLGLWAYVLAASYVLWYSLILGISAVGTAWFAFIPIWVLIQGAWLANTQPFRRRALPLLLLSLVVAVLTYKSLGVARFLPREIGTLLLAAVYWVLINNPWIVRRRPLAYRPGLAFLVTLALYMPFYRVVIVIGQTAPEKLLAGTFWDLYDLSGFMGLFWYWLGLGLFKDAQDVAEWLEDAVSVLIPPHILRVMIFLVWALAVIISYVLIRGLPFGLEKLADGLGLAPLFVAIYRWEPLVGAFGLTLEYSIYLFAAIFVVAVVLVALKKLGGERLVHLFRFSAFAFVGIWGFWSLQFEIVPQEAEGSLGLWPLILFVGGLFWQLLSGSSGLVTKGRGVSLLFLGFLLAIGAFSILAFSSAYQGFQTEMALNSFCGVIYLGIPYLLYEFVYRRWQLTHVSSKQLLTLFGLGLLCGVICRATSLLLAPCLWLLVVLLTAWRWPQWDEPLDGLVYTLALSLGFVVYYSRSFWIPIPGYANFVKDLNAMQAGWGKFTLFPWQTQWWWMLFQACGAGALLGYGLSRAHRRAGWAQAGLIVLAAAASAAFLALTGLMSF